MSEDLSAFHFSILFVLPALYLFSVSLANNMIKIIIIIFLTYRMAKCVPLPINNKLDQYVHRSATSECNSILSHTHVFVHLSLCLFLTDTTDSLTFPGSIVTRIYMAICTARSSVARFSIYLCLRNQMIKYKMGSTNRLLGNSNGFIGISLLYIQYLYLLQRHS